MPKPIAPQISETAAEFYPHHFRSLNFGATYVLEAFPILYRRALYGLRGLFDEPELKLMIDVFEAAGWADLTVGLAGRRLAIQCRDGMEIHGLDKKWGVDKDEFSKKLEGLTIFQAACLEVWAHGFWHGKQRDDDMDAWIEQLTEVDR